ncbi:hypothetical protein QUB68_24955 [Microcoleus sp. A006_D1]|uniref:hypothetical protein n=1 Tax=Microcoleus sp. A006_D1 TaxID=3055267 RepID=UPI002FD3EC21
MAAAEIAEGSIETPLSSEEILAVAATEFLGINPPAKAKENWKNEHSISKESLAKHYIQECLKYKPQWRNILKG